MTNQTKNILLVAGFTLAIFLCYHLAISKTVDLKSEFDTFKQEEKLFKNMPKQLTLLKQKQTYYDSILNKHLITGASIQNNLLKRINSIASSNQLKVIAFLQPHVARNNDVILKTHQFTVQGGYNDIITLVHYLEQETKFGEIINLSFEKKKNFRTGKYYLWTCVSLRSIN